MSKDVVGRKNKMNNFTVVEPGFEFFEPTMGYMEFLEKCTRVCYKSEEHIKLGSAEKLLTKVVKEVEHLSVTEHATCIIELSNINRSGARDEIIEIITRVPLFALRVSYNEEKKILKISGNVRMWMELIQSDYIDVGGRFAFNLHNKWPFFFDIPEDARSGIVVKILDENPLTNKNNLTIKEMRKHMTLTCNLIGNRAFSHQLVRHRLAAYSQESQRYCNYGKKGFQFIIAPSYQGHLREEFIADVLHNYERYLYYIEQGIKPEDARDILPNATKTEVVATYTLGLWGHVFGMRVDNPHAQWQIKQILSGPKTLFGEILPEVFCGEELGE